MLDQELDLRVSLAGIQLKNPITTASGTFSAKESGKYYDLNALGAIITKGVSSEAWAGNGTPRIAETYGGMLNAVGLQNPGIDDFLSHELPALAALDTRIIVNVAGRTLAEYCTVVEKLQDDRVDLLEINISCPNIKAGGIGFGTSPKLAAELTREVRKIAKQPIIIKLTPNVTDVAEIARAVEAEGADALSLINTLLAMKIDVHTGRPTLWNRTGGLSGPAIKPVAVRMVYQVRRAVAIPIIGVGGIMTGEDAAEFIMAGADAISVGTAALLDPCAPIRIRDELMAFMKGHHYKSIKEIQHGFIDC